MMKQLCVSLLILFALLGCITSPPKSSINTEMKIDYVAYLPQKSMIKRYMSKGKSPWSKKEEFSEDKITITVKKNEIIFYHEPDPISYETQLQIGKKVITEYVNESATEKTNRFPSVGEVTTVNIDNEFNVKKCILTNLLNEFSHGGYHYKGEIIHEKCIVAGTIVFEGKSKKIRDTYDRYSQKGVGVIAIINDDCFVKGTRYTNDQEGCVSNGYSYEYYIK